LVTERTLYLNVTMWTVTVKTWLSAVCDWMGPQPPVADPAQPSFVTRVGPAELAVSSASCPWLVRARRGQRLNLTVHFATTRTADAGSLCGLVIEVVDGARTTTLRPPCGIDRHRQRQVLYSDRIRVLRLFFICDFLLFCRSDSDYD